RPPAPQAALEPTRPALTADDPLPPLGALNGATRLTSLTSEFIALANHRKAIRAELKAYAERVRDIETAAVTVALRARGVDLDDHPPVAVSMLIAQIARSLCNERAVGVTLGHDELRAFMDRLLTQLGAPARASAPPPAQR